MKKGIFLFAFAVVCIFLLTACKKEKEKEIFSEKPQDEEEAERYTFGFCCITMDDPYYIELESVLRKQVEAQGNVLITKNAQYDAQLQDRQVDELIEAGIDALFLTPVDAAGIEPALDRLIEAGIPIINVDSEVQTMEKVDAYIGSDNSSAGQLCGEDLLARLPQGGKIIIVECPKRNSVSERIKGFEKAIAKQGFEVVERIDVNGQLDAALQKTEEALQANPDVSVIMCGDDQTALGAIVAVKTAGLANLIIYGTDGSPEIKKEIANNGSLTIASAVQSPQTIGKEAAAVAQQMMSGEKYEKTTYIDTSLITKENIAGYDISAWQ